MAKTYINFVVPEVTDANRNYVADFLQLAANQLRMGYNAGEVNADLRWTLHCGERDEGGGGDICAHVGGLMEAAAGVIDLTREDHFLD